MSKPELTEKRAAMLRAVERLRMANVQQLCKATGWKNDAVTYHLRGLRDMGLVQCAFAGKRSLWATAEHADQCKAELDRMTKETMVRRNRKKVDDRTRIKRERRELEMEEWANTIIRRIVPAERCQCPTLPPQHERFDMLLAGRLTPGASQPC